MLLCCVSLLRTLYLLHITIVLLLRRLLIFFRLSPSLLLFILRVFFAFFPLSIRSIVLFSNHVRYVHNRCFLKLFFCFVCWTMFFFIRLLLQFLSWPIVDAIESKIKLEERSKHSQERKHIDTKNKCFAYLYGSIP